MSQKSILPRRYLIFDHIQHGAVLTHTWRGVDWVYYNVGVWKIIGDTVVIKLELGFMIDPDKGIKYDLPPWVPSFSDDSVRNDLRFKIEGDSLIDITVGYFFSPDKPTFTKYKLIHGVPLTNTSKNYYALQEGMESETDSLRYDPWLYNLLMTNLADNEPPLHHPYRLNNGAKQ